MGEKSKQALIHITTDASPVEITHHFIKYVAHHFDLQVITLTAKFPKTYLPLHHTYALPHTKKPAQKLKQQLEDVANQTDSVMVVFSYHRKTTHERGRISDILMACRDLRIPYIGIPEDGRDFDGLELLGIPVGFLIEEKEKAPLSNAFCEYCGSKVELMQPRDRGRRAKRNVEFISKILKSHHRDVQVIEGEKSSAKIEFEALKLSSKRQYKMLFISGSREYTLDDIFFHPKEFNVLWKSNIPILIINPRDDIYVLCGG